MSAPERQPWIPDDVPDEHIKDYEESLAGHLARLGWQEQQIICESGIADIAGAIISVKRDEALRRQT